MKPLPAFLLNHQAAQDAGHFTPYPTATMKPHLQPIITPPPAKSQAPATVGQIILAALLGVAMVTAAVLLRHFTR